MRALLGILLVVVLGVIAAFAFGLLDMDQTQEARLPEIKAEGGQMPGFDVDAGEVKVGTTTTEIEVPKVKTEKETVEVPTIGVSKAGDDKAE